jgi:hypothetical protein
VQGAFKVIYENLPFLIDLKLDERQGMTKFGEKNRSFNLDEMTADVSIVEDFYPLIATNLLGKLEAPYFAAGSVSSSTPSSNCPKRLAVEIKNLLPSGEGRVRARLEQNPHHMTHGLLRMNRPYKRMNGEPLPWNDGPKRSTDVSRRMDDQLPQWNDGSKRSTDASRRMDDQHP